MGTISAIDVLRVMTVMAAIAISIYVFQDNKKWINFSQGIKPIAISFGLLAMAIFTYVIQNNIYSLATILDIVILTNQTKYMVGPSRLVAMAYIVFLYGVEIILIILFKRYQAKNKIKFTYITRLDGDRD